MRAVQGALIVASSIQIILGYSQLWAICSRCNFHLNRSLFQYYILFIDETTLTVHYRFFSPLGMVPVISLVGFGLFDRGFPVVL